MPFPIQTQKLSPKNQVTLPKGARALEAVVPGDGYVCIKPDVMPGRNEGERSKVIVLMTEDEVNARDTAIRASAELSQAEKLRAILHFNGDIVRVAVDTQRRVVLPGHLVSWLSLEREIYMFSTNTAVIGWHPDEWRKWKGVDDDDVPNTPVVTPFLSV